MSYYPPPPPPEKHVPMTPEESAEHDKIWERHDKRMIGLYQKRLAALGYESDFESAKLIYENSEQSKLIDNEYRELETQGVLNDMISSLESIYRKLKG